MKKQGNLGNKLLPIGSLGYQGSSESVQERMGYVLQALRGLQFVAEERSGNGSGSYDKYSSFCSAFGRVPVISVETLVKDREAYIDVRAQQGSYAFEADLFAQGLKEEGFREVKNVGTRLKDGSKMLLGGLVAGVTRGLQAVRPTTRHTKRVYEALNDANLPDILKVYKPSFTEQLHNAVERALSVFDDYVLRGKRDTMALWMAVDDAFTEYGREMQRTTASLESDVAPILLTKIKGGKVLTTTSVDHFLPLSPERLYPLIQKTDTGTGIVTGLSLVPPFPYDPSDPGLVVNGLGNLLADPQLRDEIPTEVVIPEHFRRTLEVVTTNPDSKGIEVLLEREKSDDAETRL